MDSTLQDLYNRAYNMEQLSAEEGLYLFEKAPSSELISLADALRYKQKPLKEVTWIIDRNSNTTNVCIANCKFCNFYRRPGHDESYVTQIEEYKQKIE